VNEHHEQRPLRDVQRELSSISKEIGRLDDKRQEASARLGRHTPDSAGYTRLLADVRAAQKRYEEAVERQHTLIDEQRRLVLKPDARA
jgi:uncharacterized protein involved in exopolysaccharide biosynthesis